jgi:hypothetical protein
MAAAFRLALGAATAVLAGVLGAFVLHSTSLQPGAALVRSVFEKNALVKPPTGFTQIARTVTEHRVPIPTPGAPAAYLDIYTPAATGGGPRRNR